MNKPHVRWMIKRDMAEVMEIDRLSHPLDEQWDEQAFLAELRQRNVIGMVAEQGDAVVGYFSYSLHKSHVQLIRMAVAPNYRRDGIGTRMMDKLASKLHSHKRNRLRVDVGDDNYGAHYFLKACGLEGRVFDKETYRFVYRAVPVQTLAEQIEEFSAK